MANLYMVTVRFVSTPLNPVLIDAVVSMRGDWIRFNLETWFLATDATPIEVRLLLQKHLMVEDFFLVLPVDTASGDGWAPQWVWDWFTRVRNQYNPLPANPPAQPPGLGMGMGIGLRPPGT